jgi:hypothetical protein
VANRDRGQMSVENHRTTNLIPFNHAAQQLGVLFYWLRDPDGPGSAIQRRTRLRASAGASGASTARGFVAILDKRARTLPWQPNPPGSVERVGQPVSGADIPLTAFIPRLEKDSGIDKH